MRAAHGPIWHNGVGRRQLLGGSPQCIVAVIQHELAPVPAQVAYHHDVSYFTAGSYQSPSIDAPPPSSHDAADSDATRPHAELETPLLAGTRAADGANGAHVFCKPSKAATGTHGATSISRCCCTSDTCHFNARVMSSC